jgi:hypothetical protein
MLFEHVAVFLSLKTLPPLLFEPSNLAWKRIFVWRDVRTEWVTYPLKQWLRFYYVRGNHTS